MIKQRNRIAEILNIQYPIIQGAMSWLTSAEFVAAVSNAGGLGILGPHAGQTTNPSSTEEVFERMRQEIRKTKALTDKPFGMPTILSHDLSTIPAIVQLIVEEQVPVALVNGLDDYDYAPIFETLRAAGVKTIYRAQNPSPENARYAESLGADIYVATGFDEGGTLPDKVIGTFSRLSMIVDATNLPVAVAGGIADIRGVRASMALGAEGIYAGTVFLATQESPAHPSVKQLLVEHNALDLLLYRTSPAYYRSLPTALSRELLAMDEQGLSREEIGNRMYSSQGMKRAMLDGDLDEGYISVGNGISYIHSIRPVREVIADLMQDFVHE